MAFSCAMFVVGYIQPNLAVFTSFIKAKWPFLGNLSAILREDGNFLVNYGCEADVSLIIKGGNFVIVRVEVNRIN